MTLIAVTGGDGFIGRAVVEQLRASEGLAIRLLRRSADTHPSDDVVIGDIADPAACARLVDGADVVIHLAGLVRSSDVTALARTNVDGSANLASAGQRQGVRRFIHVSTTGVYGRPGGAVDETASHRPGNPYERSKAQAEDVVVRTLPPGSLTVIQPSNVIGVGSPIGTLRRFFGRVRAGRPVIHASAWANYVGVEDVARVIVTAVSAIDIPPAVIVNEAMPLGEFTGLVGEAVGRSGRSIALPAVVGRATAPVFESLARRSRRWDRAVALVDSTRFVSAQGAWLDRHGVRPDLRRVLAQLADEYGRAS